MIVGNGTEKLDLVALRRDFPALDQEVAGKPLVILEVDLEGRRQG